MFERPNGAFEHQSVYLTKTIIGSHSMSTFQTKVIICSAKRLFVRGEMRRTLCFTDI